MTHKSINLSKSVSIDYDARFLHTVLLGASGSGKTQKVLAPMIQQDIRNNPYAGIVVLVADGGIMEPITRAASEAGRPYLIWDPSREDCPFFNLMAGPEDAVLEELLAVFGDRMADLPPYIKTVNEATLSNAVKVLKRLDREEGVDGKYATFANMNTLLQNPGQQGRTLVKRFAGLQQGPDAERRENAEIASWFVNDYLAERSKLYENCAPLRAQVAKLANNRYLRRVLNPDFEKGERSEIDLEALMRQRSVVCFVVPQPLLGDLTRLVGTLILLKYQHAVYELAGSESFYPDQFLYVDEFQTFVHPENADLIIFGRNNRVAVTVAFQAWSQLDRGGREYKQLKTVLMANIRNTVLFSGLSKNDASYYADMFRFLSDDPESEIAANILGLPDGYFLHSLVKNCQLQPYGMSKADLIDRRKFPWHAVKDADLAALKRDLRVAPEYEDHAVAKFQKFCADNGFDEYGLAHPLNSAKIKRVLSGEPAELLYERPETEEWDILDHEPGTLMDHAPCLFQNSKTGRRCLVAQPYLPVYHLHDEQAKREQKEWLDWVHSWASDYLGVKCKVLYNSSYYYSDTLLVAFYLDGDIVGDDKADQTS